MYSLRRALADLVALLVFASCGARTGPGARLQDGGTDTIDAQSPDGAPDSGALEHDRGPQIAAGDADACYREDGELRCWGFNGDGQLGDGTEIDRYLPVKIALPWVNEIAMDRGHNCARLEDRTVRCWGLNGRGQVGAGADAGTVVLTPVTVVGLAGSAALSNRGEGSYSTFVVLSNGEVKCWGRSTEGALCGLGLDFQSFTPVDVPALGGALVVRNSDEVTCALFPGGTIQCCGRNKFGGLGDGTTTTRTEPRAVSGISGAVELAMGGDFAFARMSDGTVRGWGYNQLGNVGNGGSTDVLTPVTVPGLGGATRIMSGALHTCAALADRTLACWGDNRYGQLGDGTTQSRAVPTPVWGIRDVVDHAVGTLNTCAIVADGAVYCWGDNRYGQLGIGTTGPSSAVPVKVQGL